MAQVAAQADGSGMAGVKARLLGLAIMAAGAGLGWVSGLGPLREAQAGVQRIYYDSRIFLLSPLLLVFGLLVLVGGATVARSFSGPPRTRRDHLLIWPAFLVAAIAGGLAWWWMDQQLGALGYRNHP